MPAAAPPLLDVRDLRVHDEEIAEALGQCEGDAGHGEGEQGGAEGSIDQKHHDDEQGEGDELGVFGILGGLHVEVVVQRGPAGDRCFEGLSVRRSSERFA